MLALATALSLLAPVPGDVERGFAYGPQRFAAGGHRGIDLAAPAGAAVRSPCDGRVTHAGTTPAGRAVALRCGEHSVTLLGLERVTARRGERLRRGERIARVAPAPGHVGLHLGVRRAGDRFGYVDPRPLLAIRAPLTAPPPASPLPRRVLRPPSEAPPRPIARPVAAPGPPVAFILGTALVAATAAGAPLAIGVRRRRRRVAAAGAVATGG